MIVVIVRGGLGNQLFQVSAAMYLAVRSGHAVRIDPRFLQIDHDKRRYAIPELHFDFVEVSWALHVAARIARRLFYRGSCLPFLARNNFWSFIADREDGATILTRGLERSAFLIMDGYWQSYHYSDSLVPALRDLVVPRHPIHEVARSLLERLKVDRTVAVHVRRGDYVHDEKTRLVHGVCDTDYYKRAIQFLDERTQVESIYVFSDEIGWVRKNMPLDSRAVYVNESGALSDVDELYVMSHCHHFIIANSSFSWWAARLGSDSEKIVIAPRQWFAAPRKVPDGLIPSDWHRL